MIAQDFFRVRVFARGKKISEGAAAQSVTGRTSTKRKHLIETQ